MPARFSSSPGIPVTKKQMRVHWNLHLLFLTGRTRCIRNTPALKHGLFSIRFSQLAHQTSDFLVIRSVLYQPTFVKREEMGALSNKPRSLPVSMSICSAIVAIIGWKIYRLDEPAKKTEVREPCIKAGAFRKAFVLDVR